MIISNNRSQNISNLNKQNSNNKQQVNFQKTFKPNSYADKPYYAGIPMAIVDFALTTIENISYLVKYYLKK